MPPKTIFLKEDVINAAFTVVKKTGLNDLTVRKIAEELNSSTAPVYSCFSSLIELKKEIMKRGEQLLLEYSTKSYTKSVFLNMGTGMVLFAQENKELFRALILDSSESKEFMNHFLKTLEYELNKDELISLLPVKERKKIFNRMGIFAHGFASLICAGLLDDVDKNTAIQTMYEMGKDVIDISLLRTGLKKNLNPED